MNQSGLPLLSIEAPTFDSSEKESFINVLEKHAASIRAYVHSLMRGDESADDVAQEALLTAWAKRSEYVEGTNFKAWAFQIARYLTKNHQRKRTRREFVAIAEESFDLIEQPWSDSDTPVLDEEENALLHCLNRLGKEDRELLHIRYSSDITLESFAKQLNLPIGTIKARLSRLRETLRKQVAEHLGR